MTCHPGTLRRRIWCGRRELNPHGLAACGFSYHFGFRRPNECGFVVWTIPSPFPMRGLGAARLVSTPSRNRFRAWLGIAIAGFPDFEQFYAAGFPMGTQVLKSAASAISPRPRRNWPQCHHKTIATRSAIGSAVHKDRYARSQISVRHLRNFTARGGIRCRRRGGSTQRSRRRLRKSSSLCLCTGGA
jgi:hypothetical protein